MRTVRDRRQLVVGIALVTLATGWVVCAERPSNPVGPWLDRAGNLVPDVRLEVWTGSDHCDTSSTKFMALSWPPDEPATYVRRMESYVWHPPDDWLPLDDTPRIVQAMPSDAKNTGFHRGDLTLWISESSLRKAVFVIDGDEIQRWAFIQGTGYCF